MAVHQPYRVLLVLGMILGGWLAVAAGSTPAQASTTTTTVGTDADAYISRIAPRTRFGTASEVRIGSRADLIGYFKFVVTVPSGQTVQSASFRCLAGTSSAAPATIYRAANTWAEKNITWSKAPAPDFSHPWGTTGAPGASGWVSADVTSLVTGSGTYTLVLTDSTSAWACASRENSATSRAQLVVTSTGTTPPPTHASLPLPARGAFYYPWFPEAWSQGGVYPASRYEPTLGYYSTTSVLSKHLASLQYGGFDFAISSWWGQGSKEDARFAALLAATQGATMQVVPYYEGEGATTGSVPGSPNPSVAQLTADLNYLAAHYVSDPRYLWVGGRPALFVFGDASDSCTMATRWANANAAATTPFYLVLKVFPGYATCASQPANWHQYAPAVAQDSQGTHAFTISPGFYKYDESSPRLTRDLARWKTDVDTMNCSSADLRLVTTFNEWGEGTSVESATGTTGWSSPSGEGSYLDVLHQQRTCAGLPPPPPPPPTGTVVDAIGDGGPDTAHWNAPLAQRLVADKPALLMWSGDVRMNGTSAEWQLYDANYGALKTTTLPTPGNHDWANASSGYDVEFATDPYADTQTYCNSVTTANGWRLFSINTYTQAACMPKFQAFLAEPGTRKIVVTHEPRWSGGSHGDNAGQAAIWDAMKGHAFALVSGHDHDSQVIERDGMVQVVSGCGGADYYGVNTAETGLVYWSTSAADCTFDRFTLGDSSVKLEAVHADGSIDFTKTYPVSPAATSARRTP